MKPLVYISGPFSSAPTSNTNRACRIWDSMRCSGLVTPICPHWSLIQDTLRPISHKEWIDYDLEVVARCDAVLRLEGVSVGADQEVDFATHRGIPVFYTTRDLYEWAGLRSEA